MALRIDPRRSGSAPGTDVDEQALDELPLHLCPVCLRKLMLAVGFDPEARYQALQAFYEEQGMRLEAEWVQRRLGEIGGAARVFPPTDSRCERASPRGPRARSR